MYVSIDRDHMRVMHKHHEMRVVCDLVHIEAPHVASISCPMDMCLKDKTELELKLLYRNTVGGDHIPHDVRDKVMAFIAALPESDVVPEEVRRQAANIKDGDSKPYQYVKGAYHPARPGLLFDILSSNTQAPQGTANTVAPSNSAARPQRPAAAPRQGGVREVIWAVADRMWEAASKPTEKSAVLALRKAIMSTLETENSVKRTSSSNELGNWAKARIQV